MARFTWHTVEIISLRSSLPNRLLTFSRPFSSSTLKLFWTAGREWSFWRHCSHSGNALFKVIFKSPAVPTVSAADSNIAAITRYRMAVIRSNVLSASELQASVAFSRANLNLSFAAESVLFATSLTESVSWTFLVPASKITVVPE